MQQPSEFLRLPSPIDLLDTANCKFGKKRKSAVVSQENQFYLKDKSYTKQYADMYFHRLLKLRPPLSGTLLETWGKVSVLEKILDIDSTDSQECVVIGTIYKEMPLVPRILQQYNKETGGVENADRNQFYSEEDNLYLEDETGRTLLVGTHLNKHNFVTGT
jgi:DNA polymerase delta subunit 2